VIRELTAVSAIVGMTAIGVHFTTTRGLLHWTGLGIEHVRATLLFARRELARVPNRWREQYPTAINDVRRRG
jgi:hypothetical protein